MKPLAAIRCPFCKRERKVFYLYSSETYWCAGCKVGGLISNIDPSLLTGITPTIKQPIKQTFEYNNKGDRFSVCKQRYSDNNRDVFQIKTAQGEISGHYTRYPNKHSHIEGSKNFCYREQFLQIGETYRLVEGVYDCVYPNDVAVLGFPNQTQVKQLKLYQLILCPDGDVWKEKEQAKRWFEPFKFSRNILAVEYIKDSKDPDECPQYERKSLSFNQVKEWLNL